MQVSINAFLRNPPISGRSHQQLYGEFLEMMEYADQNGVVRVSLAEHHFEDDGYLPSQFVMAGAIAARTTRIEIWFGIMVLPLHHPFERGRGRGGARLPKRRALHPRRRGRLSPQGVRRLRRASQ